MIDSKTPNTLASAVTVTDRPLPQLETVPNAPPAPPGRPIIKNLLDASDPFWARLIVAIILMLAGAVGQRCAHTPAPPVNLEAAPVNVNVQPASPATAIAATATATAADKSACPQSCNRCDCGPVCKCDPCGCRDCEKEVNRFGIDRANLAAKLHPGQRFAMDRLRARLSDRLQRDGFALVGGDDTPIAKERANRLVGRLSDAQVYAAGYSVGAWQEIGADDDGDGGGFLGFIKRVVKWIQEHPEQVQAILKILMMLLMFISAETDVPVDTLLVWFGMG